VRKILQSNKTFANHLDDFEAMQALAESSPYPSQAASREHSAKPTNSKKKQPPAKSGSISRPSARQQQQQDVVMTDALPPILAPLQQQQQQEKAKSPGDATASGVVKQEAEEDGDIRAPPGVSDVHALLASRVPEAPPDAELRALLAAPPLSYNQARAAWTEEDERYPVRAFCSVCGYWGKVKCVKCGTRVCALECLDVHREECVTRYGL
jgi:zinc finger HIT domain-containing protein 1